MEDEEDISNSFEQSLVQVAMLYDKRTETSEDSFSSSVDENILEEVASIFDDREVNHTKNFDIIDTEFLANDLFEEEIFTEAAKQYEEPGIEVKDASLTEMYKKKQRLENQMMKEAMWESKKVVNSILETIFHEVDFMTNYKLQYKQLAMKCAMTGEERLAKLESLELVSDENLLVELMELDEDPFNFELIDKAESSEKDCDSISTYKLQYEQLATECSRAGEARLAKLKRLELKSRKEQSWIERMQSGQSDMQPVDSGKSQERDNSEHALDAYMTILKRYVMEDKKVRIVL
jgi:hypothetical protein